MEWLLDESDLGIQQDNKRILSVIDGWLTLTPQELEAQAANQGCTQPIYSNDGSKVLYQLLDSDAYYSPYYYLWYNSETNTSHIIAVNYSGELFKIPNDALILYDRTSLAAFDLNSGEKLENYGPKFDFGQIDDSLETERVIFGLNYDSLSDNYVIAYTTWADKNEESNTCRVHIAVFDKYGNAINDIDSGLDIRYAYKHIYVYAEEITFPKEGQVYLSFNSGFDPKEITVSYLDK